MNCGSDAEADAKTPLQGIRDLMAGVGPSGRAASVGEERIELAAPEPRLIGTLRDSATELFAEIGLTVPDHKVIRGKSTRAFVVSEEEVVAAATAYVPKDAVYTTPKLKSPAQLEKLGKEIKKLVQGVQNPKYDPQVEGSQEWLIEPLAKKRPGKLTLVHVSQPGEEVAIDAASDFEDPYEDEGAED